MPLSRNQAQVHQALRQMQKVQKEHSTRREARSCQNSPPQCYCAARDGRQQRRCIQRQIFQQRGSQVRHDR